MKINKGAHPAIFRRKKNAVSNKKKMVQKQLSQWTPLDTKSLQNTSPNQTPQENKTQPIQKQENNAPVVIKRNNKEAQAVPASEISRELLRIRGTWPFDMAQDELIIEEKRIIIKRNTFPFGRYVLSLPIKKLVSFKVNHAFFYSALYIKGEGNSLNYVMQWLKPKDAIRAKELVDGLRLQESELIEIKEKDPQKIAQTLESIGHT
jgi:hypothetical protein